MAEHLPDDWPAGWRGLVAKSQAQARHKAGRFETEIEEWRERSVPLDIGMCIYERDKDAAGTLLGSALALRLFLFFVPFVLFVLGVAGLLGRHAGVDDVSSTTGFSGTLADQIDGAFQQSSTSPWLALFTGLFGAAWAGRSLSRALVVSSALSWRLGGKQKNPVRVVGAVVAIVVGVTSLAVILNRIREASGLALASVSFVAVAAVYLVLWLFLFHVLPASTGDPGAALPGAALVALVLTGMQAVSQLYLPQRLDSASQVYGNVGIAIVTLGWFFIIGRVVAFGFALNAVLYERIGSVSTFVFGLPVVRLIPRRWPAVARFFDLPAAESAGPEDVDDRDTASGSR